MRPLSVVFIHKHPQLIGFNKYLAYDGEEKNPSHNVAAYYSLLVFFLLHFFYITNSLTIS